MALTKNVELGSITIYRTGQIGIQSIIEIFEDGEFVAEKSRRKVLNPGSNVLGEPKKIRDICALIWTQAVVDAWIASQQNQEGL